MSRALPAVLVLTLLGAGLAACGHASSRPAPAGTTAAPDDDHGPVVGPPEVAWKDLDARQRARYMAKVVVPAMAPLFQGFDAKRFADFGCKTCHGKGVADHFKMPNPDLLAIPAPGDRAAFAPIYARSPAMVVFMGGKVMPTMAKLLGKEPFDYLHPKPDAFGCLGCHTEKR